MSVSLWGKSVFFKNTVSALCVALPLSACVKSLPIQPQNNNVVVNYSPEFDTSRLASKSSMIVRTIGKENGKAVEVVSNCELSSNELHLNSFQTPARLVVPKFVQNKKFSERGRPAHVRLACKNGEHFVVESVTATDKEIKTATNAGIAGAILTTVVTAAVAATAPWQLPPSVTLNYGDLSSAPSSAGSLPPANASQSGSKPN